MYQKILLVLFTSLVFTACSKNEKLPEKCYKEGKTGMCKAYFIKYYFNQETNKCEKYVFGGCGESAFDTLKECQTTCER